MSLQRALDALADMRTAGAERNCPLPQLIEWADAIAPALEGGEVAAEVVNGWAGPTRCVQWLIAGVNKLPAGTKLYLHPPTSPERVSEVLNAFEGNCLISFMEANIRGYQETAEGFAVGLCNSLVARVPTPPHIAALAAAQEADNGR